MVRGQYSQFIHRTTSNPLHSSMHFKWDERRPDKADLDRRQEVGLEPALALSVRSRVEHARSRGQRGPVTMQVLGYHTTIQDIRTEDDENYVA